MPSSAATSTNINSLISSLKDKIQFRDLTEILKSKELGTAIGWKQLQEKIESGTVEQSLAIELVLQKLHSELVISGTKDVHVFSLDDEQEAAAVVAAFDEIVIPDGPFVKNYPLPISATLLSKQSREIKITHKVTRANGDVSLVFCSVRTEVDRTEYTMSEVSEAIQVAFDGYDSFLAMKKREYQIFDITTIRKSLKRIEILIDHPDRLRDKETSEDRCLALLGAVSNCAGILNQLYTINTPTNLFPCINSLYLQFGEGLVQKLSFRAPSKSLKKESVSSKDDLRKEPFHEAGIKAVGTITVFDITVFWEKFFNATGGAAVRIHIPIGGLSTVGSYVRSAKIIDAKNDETIIAIVNKLISYSN